MNFFCHGLGGTVLPINIIFGATILGLIVAPFYFISFASGTALFGISASLALLFRRHSSLFKLSLFIAFFCLVNVRYPYLFQHGQDITELGSGRGKVAWTAVVRTVNPLADGRSRLDVQLLAHGDQRDRRKTERQVTVRVYVGDGSNIALVPGDVVTGRSRFRKPRAFGAPGEFDWPRYLQGEGVVLTTWVSTSRDLRVVESSDLSVLGRLYRLRRAVGALASERLPPPQASLVRALVLGESKLLPADIRGTLARTGVSHLFAISGLHVGLIGVFVYTCFLQLWKWTPICRIAGPPQRIIPLLIAPLLLMFLFFTGGALATQRACYLAVIGATLLIFRYHVNNLQLLTSLAVIFLWIKPLVLWSVGWQLSFVGAAAIIYVAPVLQAIPYRGVGGYCCKLFAVSIVATVATLPLVVANFHMFAPLGAVVNLVAVPLVTLLALPIGFAAVLIFPFSLAASSFCLSWCGFLLDTTVRFCRWFESLPGFSGFYYFPSREQVVLAVVMALLAVIIVRSRAWKVRYACLAGLVVVLGLWHVNLLRSSEGALTMISVGQGEAILVQDGKGGNVLVDGGGLYSDTFDVGERIVAPTLGMLGIHSLSAVVLTHDHPDHRKGLSFILEHFEVGEFYAGKSLAQLDSALSSVIAERGTPYIVPAPGWQDIAPGGIGLRLFSPAAAGSSENDGSLVLLWRPENSNGVLLTGDLEERGVRELIAEDLGEIDILKLPHHGSRFSATAELIDVVTPEVCLVSAGYGNRYHLPARSVVGHIEHKGIQLLRTDLHGTVRIRLDHGGWVGEKWINGLFR